MASTSTLNQNVSFHEDDIDNDILIDEIDMRPLIYDKSLKDYSNSNLKAKAWEEVSCKVFFNIWGNLSTKEKTEADQQYASMPDLFYQDNYDKCMLMGDDALYCYFTYQLHPLNDTYESEQWRIIKEVSSNDFNYRHDRLRHWICVPFTCPRKDNNVGDDIEKCYNKKLKPLGLRGEISNLFCEDTIPKYPVDWIDISVAFFFICYVGFVIYATCYEGSARYRPETEYKQLTSSKFGRIMTAFSITINWSRLKAVNTNPDIQRLTSFQGVRFYNTILVILSHTAMSMVFGPVANTKYTETMSAKVANLFLSSGPLCVSTFFFISAFFLILGIFDQYENKELTPKHLIMIAINRYIRLTPTFAAVIIYQTTWWRHFGSGPNWNNLIGKEFLKCRRNWWTNLLYINNLVDSGNMCMPHTWYLALDTQYFILLLMVIWVIKKYQKYIWTILITLLCINILGTFLENYIHDFEALLIPRAEYIYEMKLLVNNPQWHYQIISWIGNTSGSIIGLALGYRYLQNRNKNPYKGKEMFYQILFYIQSYGFGLGVILLPGTIVLMSGAEHDAFWASLHVAMCRPIFSIGIGIAIYRTAFGLGWLTKYVMQWHPACILGRLSYTAYLVHVCIVMSRVAISRYPIYLNDMSIVSTENRPTMIYYLLGDLSTTYLVALLITLFIEMPVSYLQKQFLTERNNHIKNTDKED